MPYHIDMTTHGMAFVTLVDRYRLNEFVSMNVSHRSYKIRSKLVTEQEI